MICVFLAWDIFQPSQLNIIYMSGNMCVKIFRAIMDRKRVNETAAPYLFFIHSKNSVYYLILKKTVFKIHVINVGQ